MDLDIDSDNNNGFERPDRSDAEDEIEDIAGDAETPGKIMMVNDGDENEDGVPNYADGFSNSYFDHSGEDAGGKFVPLILEIGEVEDDEKIRVKFAYPASDPREVEETTDDEQNITYSLPINGSLRLWTVNGNVSRDSKTPKNEGHYVAPEDTYSLADFGEAWNTDSRELTLYVEAVRFSDTVGKERIEVDVGTPDSDSPGEDFNSIGTDAVRITVFTETFVEITSGAFTTPTKKVEYSHPTPIIAISSIAVSNPTPVPANGTVLCDIALQGNLASTVCDIVKGTDGIIDSIDVYINDSDAPARTITPSVSKDTDQSSFIAPFPFWGTINTILTGVELLEGINILRFVAADKIFGYSGFSEHAVEINGNPPTLDDVTVSLRLFSNTLSPSVTESLEATLRLPNDFEFTETLLETTPSSNIFSNTDGSFTVTLNSPPSPFSPGGPEVISASVHHSVLGNFGCSCEETADDSLIFTGLVHLPTFALEEFSSNAGFTYTVGPVTLLGKSQGGFFKPHGIQLQGPAALFETFDHRQTSDGPREIIQGPDDKYYMASKAADVVAVLLGIPKPGQTPLEQLESQLNYAKGFVKGFWDGGCDLVEGLWTIASFSVKESLRFSPLGMLYVRTFGDNYESEKQLVMKTAGTVKTVADIFLRIINDDIAMIEAMIIGDDDTVEAIGEPYQIAFEFCIELFKKLADKYIADDGFRGYVHGRVTFEIVTLVIAELKVTHVSKLSKLGFLKKLQSMPFFQTGKAGEAMGELAAFIAKMERYDMCFPAGTLVHTPEGLRPIESINAGDKVLTLNPHSKEPEANKVLRVHVTNPSNLYRLQYRLEPRVNADEFEIVATGEHPFFISNQDRFTALELLRQGDRLTSRFDLDVIVEHVEKTPDPKNSAAAYNLEVENHHTYFVGPHALLVHNKGGDACSRLFSIWEWRRTRRGESVEQAWQWVENKFLTTQNKHTQGIANALVKLIIQEDFGGVPTKLFTKGKQRDEALNLFVDHYLKHKNEWPVPKPNGLRYFRDAKAFVDGFPTPPPPLPGHLKRWTAMFKGELHEYYFNKVTREQAILMRGGPESGAFKTFFPRTGAGSDEAWARSNGFKGAW